MSSATRLRPQSAPLDQTVQPVGPFDARQRAALEGTFAADIFEDQIASAVRVPESRFAKALVAALAHPHAQRTAS